MRGLHITHTASPRALVLSARLFAVFLLAFLVSTVSGTFYLSAGDTFAESANIEQDTLSLSATESGHPTCTIVENTCKLIIDTTTDLSQSTIVFTTIRN